MTTTTGASVDGGTMTTTKAEEETSRDAMWAALSALRDTPTLIVRGGRSDVLSQPVAERMLAALDQAELVTLPGVGHAPTLAEEPLRDAIDRLLGQARA